MKMLPLGLVLTLFFIPVTGWATPATVTPHGAPLFNRDAAYEQHLRFAAAADQTITPAKVLRWMRGLGDPMKPHNDGVRTEFRPMFAVEQDELEVIAAFSFKF